MQIDGDTYIFSKIDALLYEKGSFRIKDIPLQDGLLYLKKHHPFDDWGAFVMMSSILRIVPSKIFLNFCYVIMGGITAVMIFNMGCRLMSKQYAYIAALAYTISSYNVFFYGAFLKETGFILLIVLLFNSLYKYIIENNSKSIVYVILYSILICFFRPATTAFIWLGIAVYYLHRSGNNIGKVTMLFIIGVVAIFMSTSLLGIFDRYTLDGNIDKLLDTKESTSMGKYETYILNFFAALFGPFPTLIGTDSYRSCLYGPGLLYKFLMNLPFWFGVWKILKGKIVYLYPMLFFFLIEAFSVAVVQKGFELRLTLPHIAIFFMLAFWYLDTLDVADEVKMKKYMPIFWGIAFAIVMGWNMLRN